jgi:hypothetical protein
MAKLCLTAGEALVVRAKRAKTVGRQARAGEKMYRVPPDRAWWPAVGAPLERGVSLLLRLVVASQNRTDCFERIGGNAGRLD